MSTEKNPTYRDTCLQCAKHLDMCEEAKKELADIKDSEQYTGYLRYISGYAYTDEIGRMKPLVTAWLAFNIFGLVCNLLTVTRDYAAERWGKFALFAIFAVSNIGSIYFAMRKVRAERAHKGLR